MPSHSLPECCLSIAGVEVPLLCTKHPSPCPWRKWLLPILYLEISLFMPWGGQPSALQVALGPQRPSRGPCTASQHVPDLPARAHGRQGLFQPVQSAKPEGTVAFPTHTPPRTATHAQPRPRPQGHVRGRPPIATFSAIRMQKVCLSGGCALRHKGFLWKEFLSHFPWPHGDV